MTQAQEQERDRGRMRRHMRRAAQHAPPPQMPRFGGPQIFVGIPGYAGIVSEIKVADLSPSLRIP